ncbi:sodium-dependent glucose transporter 1A-like [Amblyomma americanum]
MTEKGVFKRFDDVRYQRLPNPENEKSNRTHGRTFSPQLKRWLNLGRTFNVSLGNLGMGLITALSGVTLLDLGEIYCTSISVTSHLITTRSIGGLLGSLLGGKLYDTYNTQLTSILMILVTSVTVLMVPLSGTLLLAHVMIFFMGLSLGAFGTGANVWIINMWPEDSSPALHIFHFAFAAGSLVAPLIAKPFLSTVTSGDALSLHHGANVTNPLDPASNESYHDASEPEVQFYEAGLATSRVYYAFGIVSAFYLFIAFLMTVLYCVDNADFRQSENKGAGERSGSAKEKLKDVRFSRISLALLSVYECVYVALECTTSQMLTAFAVKSGLHFSKVAASQVAAVYFSFFAVSRLVAAVVAMKVSSFYTLVFTHVILVVTGAVMVVWGSSVALVLWAGSAITGFGQGPIKAAVVAWTADYISISNKMMSVVVVTGSIGNLAPAVLVGQFIDENPDFFLYVCLGAVLFSVVIFIAMHLYMRKRCSKNSDKEGCIASTEKN